MLRIVIAAAMLCALLSNAEARARRSHHGLPWCGIYMSKYFGKSDRRLWVAREWAREGRPASGPEIGAVVVWRHHVGVITGRQGAHWIVHSGNDGGRVRTRPRSVGGAIAFRRV